MQCFKKQSLERDAVCHGDIGASRSHQTVCNKERQMPVLPQEVGLSDHVLDDIPSGCLSHRRKLPGY